MRKIFTLYFMLLLSGHLLAQQPLTELRTNYPLNIYFHSGTGMVPVGRTNSTLDPSQAAEILSHPKQIILAPEWVPENEISEKGVLIHDFVEQGIRADSGIWPNKGVYKPEFETAVSVRLFLTHRWYLPAGLGALILLAGVAAFRFRKQLRRREDLDKRHETLRFMLDDLPKGDPRLGKRFGKHILIEKVGTGGMAIVYRGLPEDNLKKSEAVAVKILQPHLVEEMNNKERFRREIVLCSELNHPNIIKVLDYGETPELFYAMEFVQGSELRELLPLADKSLANCLSYLRPVFQALHYAHGKGVVHRDVKPENVMVEAGTGRILVTDFGLARKEDLEKITATGTVLGTALYLAPEQVNGLISAATDQYALGTMLYELLAGRCPFEGQEMMQVIVSQMQAEPTDPREFNPDISPEVVEVLFRMLKKEPAERFPDLNTALASLEKLV